MIAVFDRVHSNLIHAELDLGVAIFCPSSAFYNIFASHLFIITAPGVRKDGVRRDFLFEELRLAEFAVIIAPQEAHAVRSVDGPG